ncbi:adenine phosphoribosyltransferase [Rubritalea squalenifaciens DSM 18772]|uniref:Adenine phosphoribosyltransferase n=2 Tax=Rubritalea TaxID=361050 RepID=A0A1M6HGP7_9BACT|nr:adenine phosphoribosyltransferase [Rubritalea squalenifaciens]SHJ21304.1 adenine phosphoribosyltransferase [Rubritalea squalenifaciens DSM 18772]
MPDTLRQAIRDVVDFPKPGIIFKDITPILSDAKLLRRSVELLVDTVSEHQIDKVAGIDARGFIFGAPAAIALNAGFVPIRKQGKLPWETHSLSYTLEYGTNTIEVHKDAIKPGEKVLLIDDLLATGGTAAAAIELLRTLGAETVCASFLVELSFLEGRSKLALDNVQSIITF